VLLSVILCTLFVFSLPAGAAFGANTYDLAAATSGTVQAPAGGTGTLTVTWQNKGPEKAPRAALAVTPPIGTALGVLPTGWQRSGNSAIRTAAALASGGSGTASFRVLVNKNAVPGGLLVGGFFKVSGTSGVDGAPANNEAAFRVGVSGGKATPSPTPSVKVTATPTVKPTATPTVKPTVKPTAKPIAPKTVVAQAVPPKASAKVRPSPKVSTHLAVAPSASDGSANDAAASGVIEVTDGSGDTGSSVLVPLVGALTCFTAAGLGVVVLRRRRLDARADAAELRSMRSR